MRELWRRGHEQQSRRLRVFTDAYGIPADTTLLNAIRGSQALMSRVVAGTPAVNKHVEERRWLAEHGQAFVDGG